MNDMNVSEVVENLDADQIKKLSSEDIEKLRQIFKLIFEAIEMFGRLKDGACDNGRTEQRPRCSCPVPECEGRLRNGKGHHA